MSKTATAPKSKSAKASIRPLGAKVIVQRDEAEDRTESGLYLPEKAKDKPRSGLVTAVGPGRLSEDTGERIAPNVKKGDKVLFTSYAGTEIKLEGVDLLIMDEDDILAVID
ncbi:MAG: co-chaperone GroES [Phycisphaerales bacterium]|jgi:chaperonin GroES|nr:MAG: co-chaperone GroES [Phycisphaerales bacterium]